MTRQRKIVARLVPREQIDAKKLAKALVEIALAERERKQERADEAERHRQEDAS